MSEFDLAQRFEAHRRHLHAVAYRMLGSLTEADDAVQEAWLRACRSGAGQVVNLHAWLTTVVARVALDMLRARSSRREEPWGTGLPDPVVELERCDRWNAPEAAALQIDSVSVALLVVLEALSPAERLVFVLHDLFAVPFDEIGEILGRSPAAAKQLASRARRRVRGHAPAVAPTDPADLRRHRQVVSAFVAAARGGDLEGLLTVLDPEVVLRVERGTAVQGESRVVVFTGARQVAEQAVRFAHFARFARRATVNGAAGVVTVIEGVVFSVQAFTVRQDRITEINLYADRQRLRRLPIDVG